MRMLFNDLIQHLDLIDVPFELLHYTWSNMQEDALLEKLDWVFTSAYWSLSFPATKVQTPSRPISDHVPYSVIVGTSIPKSSQFHFENYWVDFAGFFDIVDLHWNNNPFFANMARTISGKFKQLRTGLKKWSREFSKLGQLINNCNWVIPLLDGLDEKRPMSSS